MMLEAKIRFSSIFNNLWIQITILPWITVALIVVLWINFHQPFTSISNLIILSRCQHCRYILMAMSESICATCLSDVFWILEFETVPTYRLRAIDNIQKELTKMLITIARIVNSFNQTIFSYYIISIKWKSWKMLAVRYGFKKAYTILILVLIDST